MPQAPLPDTSVTTHRPAEQPVGHARPQPPQLLLSVCSFTHRPPQADWPAGHVQAPVWQLPPVAQVVPHAPQLFGSVCSLTHEPLQELWRQAQAPWLQTGVGWAQATAPDH